MAREAYPGTPRGEFSSDRDRAIALRYALWAARDVVTTFKMLLLVDGSRRNLEGAEGEAIVTATLERLFPERRP